MYYRNLHRGFLFGVSAFCVSSVFCAQPAAGQFGSDKVSLHSQIDLITFGANSGNDCWGYTSPSGREYALMGLSNKIAFVEITNPASPDWFASIGHTNNLWGDVKVYQDVAYASTETSTGIQVMDLSNIDNHIVTLVRTMSSPPRSHNIVIDEENGFLYTVGSNGGAARTVIFDLSNPLNPVQVGTWGTYEHDAQIVTYQSGPWAGRQIMIGASEGRGLDIVDVTNKSNPFLLSRTPYPNVSYCHQVWTEDLQYAFINDELDNIPRTIVFDISDLANPQYIGEFTSGTQSIDHNNYVREGILYAANYHSGLRIFDVGSNPTDPQQIGWFDTYPPNDGDGFDGAWSVYPFFPSGTVIVSDLDRGLFILDVSEALAGGLAFAYPQGRPGTVDPRGGSTMRVVVSGFRGVEPEPGTGRLHYDLGLGFVDVPMTTVSPNVYDAVFPAAVCTQEIPYYVSVLTTTDDVVTDPSDAPKTTYLTTARSDAVSFFEDFESDTGWTAENLGATSGLWQRGVPVDDPNWAYDPAADSESDSNAKCYLTQNTTGNTDVDNGAVRLTSPTIDMSAGDIVIAYDYFLRLTDSDGTDRLLVEINNDDGAGPWIEIARHDTDGGLSWRHHEITQADLEAAGVTPTSMMVMRFTANDGGAQSIVESALDALSVSSLNCPQQDADIDNDGDVDLFDVSLFEACFTGDGDCTCIPALYMLAGQPECIAADADLDGDVDADDYLVLFNELTGP